MDRVFEDCRERRGEPVRATVKRHTYDATIEWGDDRRGYSVCLDPGGARFIVGAKDLAADPGGSRPLWERREAEARAKAGAAGA